MGQQDAATGQNPHYRQRDPDPLILNRAGNGGWTITTGNGFDSFPTMIAAFSDATAMIVGLTKMLCPVPEPEPEQMFHLTASELAAIVAEHVQALSAAAEPQHEPDGTAITPEPGPKAMVYVPSAPPKTFYAKRYPSTPTPY